MILCTGSRSTILQALAELMPHEEVRPLAKRTSLTWDLLEAPPGSRVVIAQGFMAHKPIADQTDAELDCSRILNAEEPMALALQALLEVPGARICIIGSWSARCGSFDGAYAAWKRTIHSWVERQAPRVRPPAQLVCVAPPIIADSAMTRARKDYPAVLETRPHCFAMDVARTIKAALWETEPGTTAPIILMPATAGPEPRTCPC